MIQLDHDCVLNGTSGVSKFGFLGKNYLATTLRRQANVVHTNA